MTFGLSEKSMNLIVQELKRQQAIEEAGIFGSRAMGNYKRGSDVDLVIYGPTITEKIIRQLSIALNEELPLPYYFDIVHYESISSDLLKKHIDEVSRIFFKRSPF